MITFMIVQDLAVSDSFIMISPRVLNDDPNISQRSRQVLSFGQMRIVLHTQYIPIYPFYDLTYLCPPVVSQVLRPIVSRFRQFCMIKCSLTQGPLSATRQGLPLLLWMLGHRTCAEDLAWRQMLNDYDQQIWDQQSSSDSQQRKGGSNQKLTLEIVSAKHVT